MPSPPTTAKPGTPVILGIPFDANSSWLRGAAGAPPIIRVSFRSDSSNSWTDHSITLPILRAFGKRVPGLTIIHFDAHPDLYDELEGNRHSHACPFARVMEEGAAQRLIQVGIRTMNGHQREQAKKFGVEVIEMRHLPALDRMKIEGPIYISFDMDALDPAFAPGISHREPGGMSVREVLAHIHAITGKIAGADIVEFNPAQDHTQITAMVGAKLLKEILGKMIGG